VYRRAPCIWSVRQRVDPHGTFRVFAGAARELGPGAHHLRLVSDRTQT
jgi:hypothetical protein